MKTLIGYVSQHGCTESCAVLLKERLNGDIDLVNLKKEKTIDLAAYERVLLGGSIHAGNVQGAVKKFCQRHEAALLEKELGLFICCMETDDKANEQFNKAFPASLRTHAKATAILGGQLNFDRMNVIEKTIMKKIAGTDQNTDQLDKTAMETFVTQLTQ